MKAGDRVIDNRGNAGSLVAPVFHGNWEGYKLGWIVSMDSGSRERTLESCLTQTNNDLRFTFADEQEKA